MNDNTTYTGCSGFFTDSQGGAADYLPGELLTTTFCSPFTTDRIRINFTQFDLAPGDILIAYDGEDASAPFIGAYGSFAAPGIVEASATNPTGCLTFVFTSNPTSPGAAGWNGNIICVDDCQTISSAVITVPAADSEGIVRICQGDTVTVNGTPGFSNDGTGATFQIRLPNGNLVNGDTASETFPSAGIFSFDFIVTDVNGCRDRTLEDVVVLVSTTPDFTGTEALQDIVCFGDTVDINGIVESTQFFAEVAPPVTGQTFLPDGSGAVYETSIEVQGFGPGSTLNNASDLVSIFVNIEHSYMGDLDIFLTAPNGTVVDLLVYPNTGGGRYLGQANDDGTNIPGVGFVYNFTEGPTATQTLRAATAGVANATPMPAGDYLPESPFSALIGTDLNGFWTLTVRDNLAIDNGYIFEWGLIFNPAIIPNAGSFQPGEVTESFSASPEIINTVVNGDVTTITVQPSVVGQNCYSFNFTDDFGCTYTEEVCVEMAAEIVTATPTPVEACVSLGNTQINLRTSGSEALAALPPLNYSITYHRSQTGAEDGTDIITNVSNYNITNSDDVFIRILNRRTNCFEVETLVITLSDVTANVTDNLEICDDEPFNSSETFDLTSDQASTLGSQTLSDVNVTYYQSQAAADAGVAGTEISTPATYVTSSRTEEIFIRVADANDLGCYDTTSFILTIVDLPDLGTAADLTICDANVAGNATSFDLTSQQASFLGAIVPGDVDITYYTNSADAEAGISGTEIGTPTDYLSTEDAATIFVRVQERNAGCFSTASFTLNYSDVAFDGALPYELCDTFPYDSTEVFDLTLLESEFLSSIDANDVSVTYYTTAAAATSGTPGTEITDPANYTNTAVDETLFVRVEDADSSSCFITGDINLILLDAPPIGSPMDLVACDEAPFDLRLEFDLSLQDDSVLGGLNSTEYSVAYFISEQDAVNNNNQLSTLYTAGTGDVIFARLTDNLTGCDNITTFTITVEGCEVIFPEGFSPNNDGTNETFEIPNIEQYANFELKVFNRLGSVVFETTASNYTEFNGIPNTGLNSGDGLLPVGTYFYVMKFNEPGLQDIASWLYINY
jgi:gliding motility-associated-like protein